MRHAIVPAFTRGRLLPLLVVLAAVAADSLGAQGPEVSIDGAVRGADGEIPAGATVDVINRTTGAVRHAAVDQRGRYLVLALAPGRYDVTAYALGYRPERRTDVVVVVGERSRLDFTLVRGAVELAPTVVTADRRADVRRADVSTAVLPEDVRELPLNARNALDVAVAAPGVRTHGSSGGGVPQAGPSNAARFGNVYIDGVELKGLAQSNLVGAPGAGSIVSQDAIREFRIMLDPYDVEWGHGASWVISAVTWEGTNRLEGSLFAFGQNRDLVATRSFADAKPRYARAQIGGSLRGPLVRDRLFFAATVEQQRTDNFLTVVPGRPAADPGRWDAYAGTYHSPVRNDMGTLRLTAPLGAHTLDLSASGRHLASEYGFGVRSGTVMLGHEAGTAARYDVTVTRLRDSWVSGHVANELSVELLTNRSDEQPMRPGPAYRYPGLQRGISSLPTRVSERHLGLSEKAVVAFHALGGGHIAKIGGDAQRTHGEGYQPGNRDGLFLFATDTSSLPYQASIGVGYYDSTSTADARSSNDGWLLDAYVQDQIRPVAPLTLTAGLRWDADINTLNQAQAEPFARDTTLMRVVGDRYLNDGDRRNTLDNFAPRLSAVWDVGQRGRTFLRAGYGIMYDRVPVYGAFYERVFWQWRTYTIGAPGTTDPAVLRTKIRATGPTLHLLPDRMRTPSTRQWSVGVGTRLAEGVALNVDYIDQHLRNVYVTVRANTLRPGSTHRFLTDAYGDLYLWGDFGDGTYRGLLTSLTADRGRSRTSVAYTLSSARSEFNIVSTNDYPDSSDYRMQRSQADERHRLVVTQAARLARGFSVSGIGVLASPQPFLVTVGTDANRNGAPNDDWPEGRRTARNGGSNNWYRELDLRLAKTLGAGPGGVTITAECFNVFNVGNHLDYQGVQNNLGYRRPVADYPRRQGQLGLRWSF
ncbi:MAG: TonB-dependent receptor [Gemmatimonadaceae bacterium]|nr:TonB-dependent receptor [Gemmatimonadaceae bacterium]NUQ91406.1 TonB-dependent receptor [Gemmatimonadaceae bacterium]NUR20563.1 TonB-dependent receptor [Gemmatimonadaceae bacterium]